MSRIRRPFFDRPSPAVAREILGMILVRVRGGRRLSGRIVEAEAYEGAGDPASHAFIGRTARNEVMFGAPGHAYVYFTMGLHNCLNVTTEPVGIPGAVLIRALEPIDGVEAMMRARRVEEIGRIANGPANLTKAMWIGRELDGEDMVTSPRLFLEPGTRPIAIGASSRVGIRWGRELQWRFYVENDPFVSKGRPSMSGSQNP